MSTRTQWLAEKRAEIEQLRGLPLTEITPSRRDFTLFVSTQKRSVVIIPRLKRADPFTGKSWPDLDIESFAKACDEADAPALAVATATIHGGTVADLQRVAAVATAPLLRDDLCIHVDQLYQARLHGADAVILPLSVLGPAPVLELAGTTASMHMMPIIEVTNSSEIQAALTCANACIGLQCPAANGYADVNLARGLAQLVPPRRTTLLLTEVVRLEVLRELDGMIDAAVVGNVLLDAPDGPARLAAWIESGSDA